MCLMTAAWGYQVGYHIFRNVWYQPALSQMGVPNVTLSQRLVQL